jgi:hypothetical protein
MKLTHIILTRDDGTRLLLTVDEARQLWGHLGLVFAQPLPLPVYPAVPAYWPPSIAAPTWVPAVVVTCEATA